MKVDLDIAGNCEMESMRSIAVLVGRTNKPRRARAEKLRGDWEEGRDS